MSITSQNVANSPTNAYPVGVFKIPGSGVELQGVVTVDTNGNPTSAVNIPTWDYMTLTQASTTDTYTFKTGGSGGTTVSTIVITYTDSGKGTISTVART